MKGSQTHPETSFSPLLRGEYKVIVDFLSRHHKNYLPLAIALPLLAVLALSTPVQAAPVITLTPASGAIGTEVTVSGTVFDSYKGDNIYIFFDNTEVAGSPLVVPDTGTFTIQFNIPDDATPGRHWVEARQDTASKTILTRNFFIIEEVDIYLDVADGPVDTEVTVSGCGFYANRIVTLYYHNIVGEKLGDQAASPTGEFSYHFTIPHSTAGKHKITAVNTEDDSAEIEFVVIPTIVLNLTSAGPGELLTVKGTGFSSKGDVDIDFAIYRVAKARTDEFGSFEVKFNIPNVKPDAYDIKAQDKDNNTAKARFVATASAHLNQTTGSVGTKLTVHGSGFKAGGTVTVDYDNLRVAATTIDNNGDFSASFNVPAGNSGRHVITASDGETTKQLAFTVESEEPPVPRLLLPAAGSDTRARAYLDWKDVADPSLPITYRLQVASDQNFSSLVMDKPGLSESEYTLTEEEQLPAEKGYTSYYWRVKAIDGANNESEWTTPWAFYVNPPTVPALMLPAYDSQTEMPIYFNWQAATSLNPPVTYRFQLANDQNFTTIMLEKEGMTDPEYTLTEDEELPGAEPDAPYHWRVKAIDSANNESEWAAPWSFYIVSPFVWPGWATYTLIVIGVIAVGFLAFRLGKRTAIRPPE